MVLEMNNGEIKVKENSCELKNECYIYMQFKDIIISNKDIIKMYINDIQLEPVKPNIWKIPGVLMDQKEQKIIVLVLQSGGKTKTYQTLIEIKKYISFGKMKEHMFPQIILDQNKKIFQLENRIKEIEKKLTIF